MAITRRQLGFISAGALGSSLTRSLWAREASSTISSRRFYFALIADSHNYPSTTYNFCERNKPRLDNAKAITDGFKMPVHVGQGNHDYDLPEVPRDMSHRLFETKLSTRPCYPLEHQGHKFIHPNSCLGSTWDTQSKDHPQTLGSLGEEQLNWFETQCGSSNRLSSLSTILCHFVCRRSFPISDCIRRRADTKDAIQFVVSGHWHKWVDFAHAFVPQHYAIAATRYAPNAYMLIEADGERDSWRFLN